jgi:hypothetical protein
MRQLEHAARRVGKMIAPHFGARKGFWPLQDMEATKEASAAWQFLKKSCARRSAR